ncbi:hypothetical protein BV25DRAFT_729000 [Artomyces pyxidatus]|uniref:Uncharacterized protein n=1 Tax=Artomyces pyxidatus TaxID=48021 RepID=A0ACB8SYT4_9AGAM|nr:hypothetical protein BV25DRAFT_729000 [Artomyces pyxidatus]
MTIASMPTISCSSLVPVVAENSTLAIRATHVLVVDSSSDRVHPIEGRFPDIVDVRIQSDLVFSFSGILGRDPVSALDMMESAVVQHFILYLRMNSNQLGINAVSDVYADESSGLPISVIPSRHLDTAASSRVCLLCIHLAYIWKSTGDTSYAQVFSSKLLLPLQSVLDALVEKVVATQVVSRYPTIFGLWRRKLELETLAFPSLACSLESIIDRSLNQIFRKQAKRLIKRISHRGVASRAVMDRALSRLLASSIADSHLIDEHTDFDDVRSSRSGVLCESLKQVFKAGVRPFRFKGTTGGISVRNIEEPFDLSISAAAGDTDVPGDSDDVDLAWDDLLPSLPVDLSASRRLDRSDLMDNTDTFPLSDEVAFSRDGEDCLPDFSGLCFDTFDYAPTLISGKDWDSETSEDELASSLNEWTQPSSNYMHGQSKPGAEHDEEGREDVDAILLDLDDAAPSLMSSQSSGTYSSTESPGSVGVAFLSQSFPNQQVLAALNIDRDVAWLGLSSHASLKGEATGEEEWSVEELLFDDNDVRAVTDSDLYGSVGCAGLGSDVAVRGSWAGSWSQGL